VSVLRRIAIALLLCACIGASSAQDKNSAEARLAAVRKELREVAAERRRLEGDRGQATRALRSADEQVGTTGRALRETETRLTGAQRALADLQRKRTTLDADRVARREELTRLLRAAYMQQRQTPLQALLSQDRVAEAQRALVYHRVLQRERSERIKVLGEELAALDRLQADIIATQARLDAARGTQRTQLAQLERDRLERAALVSTLDSAATDTAQRERTLGRDAAGLEQVLRRLRRAAAKAEAERRRAERAARTAAANARRAERANASRGASGRASSKTGASTAASSRPSGSRAAASTSARPTVASAAPVQVGGLGWPLSGALLANFGGRMPDGRRSDGLLIAANAGAPVKAIADGTVVYGEWMTGYGLLLIVDHGGGTLSLYAHNDALLKDVGAAVRRGDAVATVGSSGGHGRPALYFELRRNGAPVNPAAMLRR